MCFYHNIINIERNFKLMKENYQSTSDYDKGYPISQCMAVVNDWVRDPKHRNVYEDKIRNALTYEELATKYGYSVNQISNIIKECRVIIHEHISEYEKLSNIFSIKIEENGLVRVLL